MTDFSWNEIKTWEWRVLHMEGAEGFADTFIIIEVYYNKDGELISYLEPDPPYGLNLDELKDELALYINATNKPVLTVQDFPAPKWNTDA